MKKDEKDRIKRIEAAQLVAIVMSIIAIALNLI